MVHSEMPFEGALDLTVRQVLEIMSVAEPGGLWICLHGSGVGMLVERDDETMTMMWDGELIRHYTEDWLANGYLPMEYHIPVS